MNNSFFLSRDFTVTDLVGSLFWDEGFEMYRFQVNENTKIDFENNYEELKEIFYSCGGVHKGSFNSLYFDDVVPEREWRNVTLESGPDKRYLGDDTSAFQVVYKISNPKDNKDCFYLRLSGYESSWVGSSIDKIEVVQPYSVSVTKYRSIRD